MLQNSENFNTSNFALYPNGSNPKFNNYLLQKQYKQNNFKNYNYCLSPNNYFRNSKRDYILTEKNRIDNYERIIKDSSLSNSIKYCKEYGYPLTARETHDSINIHNTLQNIPRNNGKKDLYSFYNKSSHVMNNLSNGNMNQNKRKIFLSMNSNQSYNEHKNSDYINSNSLKMKNNNNNNELSYNYRSNNIYNSFHSKPGSNILNNEYIENSKLNILKTYINNKNITFNDHNQTYTNDYNIESIKQRNNNNFYKINKYIKATTNKEIKYSKINNINSKEEIQKHKSLRNKNDNAINKENNLNKNIPLPGKKKNMIIKIENNKNSNSIIQSKESADINFIKKIALRNITNLNESKHKINNHSFYERKSFSKENHNKRNSNFVLSNMIPNKKKEKIVKNNSNHFIGNDSFIKTNDTSQTKENIIINKNSNDYGLDFDKIKSLKENINANNVDISYNLRNSNNNDKNSLKQKNNSIIINLDTENFKTLESINKADLNQDKKDRNNFKKLFLSPIPTRKSIIKEKINKININQCKSNMFSIIPKPNTYRASSKREKKKIKNVFGMKNIIQLNNINNKSYAEDFIIKGNKNKKYNYKPQISVRLTLFKDKIHLDENYFLVNFFYSENLKNKPDSEESDF